MKGKTMDNNQNRNTNRNNPNRNDDNNQKKSMIISVVVAVIGALLLTSLFSSVLSSASKEEITYSQFVKLLDNDKVESVLFESGKIYIETKNLQNGLIKKTFWTTAVNDPDLISELKNKYTDVEFKAESTSASNGIIIILLEYVVPLILFWALLMFVMRRVSGGKGGPGGVFGVGKSNAKVYIQKKTGVTFKDVAGQEEAKESVVELVDFLHNPGKYTAIGAKLPKGALLVGPPGTGKTLLAKAVAGEANVPFFSLSGSDFVEMFVGVGASRVRDLFKQAEENAPCIVFIDEIDSIGKSRDNQMQSNDEREQTLNQLLTEMDGFDTSKGIVILGATNRPEILDKALLRPGRFDRRVIVDRPDLKGRIAILNVHSKDVKMSPEVNLESVAKGTPGAVGADLANILNEADLRAVIS